MRISTLVKFLAAIGVLFFMSFTGMLLYHVFVTPLGGVFEKMVADPNGLTKREPDSTIEKLIDSSELPVIDPSDKIFEKASEMLALGDSISAREKLNSIITTFPHSLFAPQARHIIGQMNLDEVFSASHLEGKKTHKVKRGNSPLSIANENHTTLDCILHFNPSFDFKSLQPGHELIVLPLDFKILIQPNRKLISVWNGANFLCEYPILHFDLANKWAPGKTKISSKVARAASQQVQPLNKDYREAEKTIQLAKPPIQIIGAKLGESYGKGIFIEHADMEELTLLTRVGNEVELR